MKKPILCFIIKKVISFLSTKISILQKQVFVADHLISETNINNMLILVALDHPSRSFLGKYERQIRII